MIMSIPKTYTIAVVREIIARYKWAEISSMSINVDPYTSVFLELSLLSCKLHAECPLIVENDGVGISQFVSAP